MKISAPKGTRDILPEEVARWQWVERVFARISALYGYQEIRIPTFEQTELFQRGVGDTTDVVQKEMYTFGQRRPQHVACVPKAQPASCAVYLENGMASWPSPVRLYYNITAFRYENVQKGRYREFHQFGCEAFGAAGPAVDAELISLLQLYFQTLGLQKTSLRINSIGCPVCRGDYHEPAARLPAPASGRPLRATARIVSRRIRCGSSTARKTRCQTVTAGCASAAGPSLPGLPDPFRRTARHLEAARPGLCNRPRHCPRPGLLHPDRLRVCLR